jgi:hypothetical protein
MDGVVCSRRLHFARFEFLQATQRARERESVLQRQRKLGSRVYYILLDPPVGSDRLSVSTAGLKCEIAPARAGIARISPNALSTILIKHDTRALFSSTCADGNLYRERGRKSGISQESAVALQIRRFYRLHRLHCVSPKLN